MADWTFYSPTLNFATVGELLRAIPSARIFRLERTFVENGKDTRELVRAAELLLDLDVTLRLQNDPRGATRIHVTEAQDAHREALAGLCTPMSPADLKVVVEVTLSKSAVAAGHLELADEIVSGLEALYPGAVVHSPDSGETLEAGELARIMDAEQQRCSHLDVRLTCDEPQRSYVCRQLQQLPAPFGSYVRNDDRQVVLRARFPTRLSTDEVDAVCNVALEMAQHARAGHVRFREHGVWRDAVKGIGAHVADIPTNQTEGVFHRLTRLLGRNK